MVAIEEYNLVSKPVGRKHLICKHKSFQEKDVFV